MNRQRIMNALYRYGEQIEILAGDGEFKVRGFIEPLRYKNRMYIGGEQVKNGYRDGGHFLLICPRKTDMTRRGIKIKRKNGDMFIIKRSDEIVFEGETLYVWAILTPYNGPKEDAYD